MGKGKGIWKTELVSVKERKGFRGTLTLSRAKELIQSDRARKDDFDSV
jgi:hypothetical protein